MAYRRYTAAEKEALERWQDTLKNISKATAIEDDIPFSEREKKRLELEDKPIEWMYHMFPNYATYEFAKFQEKAIKRMTDNPDWYEVLSWSRELAKSTIVMMCVLYLSLTGRKRNWILSSSTEDAAIKLLAPYRANLQANQRIKHYYGNQIGRKWTEEEFISSGDVAFLALGARQSPRGVKNEEVRPDGIILDDFDTDEECRNPDIIKKKWEWFEQALYFTRSMSEPLLVVWAGNIIAKDCCITRAGERAKQLASEKPRGGNWDIINLRMVNIRKHDPINDFNHGTSVWANKNTEELIDKVLRGVTQASAMKECFNNPVVSGGVFKEMHWGKVPKLRTLKSVCIYGDPSPSNNETKKNSMKAVFIVGKKDDKYYIYTGWLQQANNTAFIEWFYSANEQVNGKTQPFFYIENNNLQDPFFEQVLKPAQKKVGDKKGYHLSIAPDARKKPDKYLRIVGTLQELNREGNLIFNENEKGNPHMQRLEEQFLMLSNTMKFPADGPDTVEGAVWLLNYNISNEPISESVIFGKAGNNNKKRY